MSVISAMEEGVASGSTARTIGASASAKSVRRAPYPSPMCSIVASIASRARARRSWPERSCVLNAFPTSSRWRGLVRTKERNRWVSVRSPATLGLVRRRLGHTTGSASGSEVHLQGSCTSISLTQCGATSSASASLSCMATPRSTRITARKVVRLGHSTDSTLSSSCRPSITAARGAVPRGCWRLCATELRLLARFSPFTLLNRIRTNERCWLSVVLPRSGSDWLDFDCLSPPHLLRSILPKEPRPTPLARELTRPALSLVSCISNPKEPIPTLVSKLLTLPT